MTHKTSSGKSKAAAREDRLKAALKSNLARRKAQARARSEDVGKDDNDTKKRTSSEGS